MGIQDLYDDVTSGGTGEYELDRGEGENAETYTLSVRSLTRPRKNKVQSALPEGYFDPVIDPDEVDEEDIDEMGLSELKELLEENGSSLGEYEKSRTLDEEATEIAIEAMVDAYSHADLSDQELENMLRSAQFPEEHFQGMLMKMLEVSSGDDGHREFRSEG